MSTTSALTPDLKFTYALRAVNEAGAAFIEGALNETFRLQLEREVSASPFKPMPSEEGRARQEGQIFHMRDDFDSYPCTEQLRRELVRLIRGYASGIVGIDDWEPNEVHVQRYVANALGITPHLDLKRYRVLIAIVTVAGSARFTLCKDRAGNPIEQWNVTPGSLVLLRAPGLGGDDDRRPLHAVQGPPAGHRISVTWRMNCRAA